MYNGLYIDFHEFVKTIKFLKLLEKLDAEALRTS